MKGNFFGEKLKELRLEKGLSQTVSFWETGSREPDLDALKEIADYFGVSIDFLLGRTDI